MQFKQYIESDIYGFEKKQELRVKKQDDLPIQPFRVSSMLHHLLRRNLGDVRPMKMFEDEVRWGTATGAVRMKFTPNRRVVLGRLINDANGNRTWICKKTFMVDAANFTDREDVVASDIFKYVEAIAHTQIDAAEKNYSVKKFAGYINEQVKNNLPPLLIYEDMTEVNPNYFIIYCSVRGGGVGANLDSRDLKGRIAYFSTEIMYEESSGLNRIILTTVTIDPVGSGWGVDIPFFDEKFTPTQSKEEIGQAILTALKWM